MNILVLGGAKFVGRHIVEALLAAGHSVSTLSRGHSRDSWSNQIKRLRGDRDEGLAGLAALAGGSWDACVDVSGYTPREVRASAEFLRDRVKRYVFISTGSVYAEPDRHPIREEHPVLPAAPEDLTEVTNATYGPLKVTCEHIVREVYGERSTILRPQIIAGPFDHTGRYPYWVDRAARGGEVLGPGDGMDYVQVIDGRDLARFVVTVLQEGIGGILNMAGPRLTWQSFMRALGVQAVTWVDAETLKEQGLGFKELPLFVPAASDYAGLMDMSNQKAIQAGLILTDPAITAQDTRAWSKGAPQEYALAPEREGAVLELYRARKRR